MTTPSEDSIAQSKAIAALAMRNRGRSPIMQFRFEVFLI